MTRLGCTTAIIVFWLLGASLVNAANCTTSETNTLERVTEDYADKVDSECSSDECSSACVSVLSELVDELPDCVYKDGINYYEGTVGTIEKCGASSSDSTSVTSSRTGGRSSSNLCSSSEESDINDAFDTYGDDYDAACTDDTCTSACLKVLDELAMVLPDCIDSEGNNYYEATDYLISDCQSSSGGSSSGDSSNDGRNSSNVCSSSEESDINDAFDTYGSNFDAACTDGDTCTSACLAVLDDLATALPDCVDSEGINYYEDASDLISTCASPSGGSGSVDSSNDYSSSSNVCSSAEEADINDAFYTYGDDFDAACTDSDICTSACLEALDKLAVALPDCVDSEGVNYYEDASYLIYGCSGPSDGSDGSDSQACSSSEEKTTHDILASYHDEYTAACDPDACTTACVALLARLVTQLPDCVYSSGTNYFHIALGGMTDCSAAGGDSSSNNIFGNTDESDSTSASEDSRSSSNGSPNLNGLHVVIAAVAMIAAFVV